MQKNYCLINEKKFSQKGLNKAYYIFKVMCRLTINFFAEVNMENEIKLGLCNPPEPIYLYVNQGESQGESYVWYKYNIEQNQKIPVHQKGLTGYLSDLRLKAKEYNGRDNMKLEIVVAADETYIIRSGIETNFSKSFLLAASLVNDFSRPLIIAATPGEKNTVFCNIYDATTKANIKREWQKEADWDALISSIQSKLGKEPETSLPVAPIDAKPKLSVVPQVAPHPQDTRIRQIRTTLNYPLDLVKEWLGFHSVELPSLLNVEDVNQMVKIMCLAWAADKGIDPALAESAYRQYVASSINTNSELDAIKRWMGGLLEPALVFSNNFHG
jgi:hypothetical protein